MPCLNQPRTVPFSERPLLCSSHQTRRSTEYMSMRDSGSSCPTHATTARIVFSTASVLVSPSITTPTRLRTLRRLRSWVTVERHRCLAPSGAYSCRTSTPSWDPFAPPMRMRTHQYTTRYVVSLQLWCDAVEKCLAHRTVDIDSNSHGTCGCRRCARDRTPVWRVAASSDLCGVTEWCDW